MQNWLVALIVLGAALHVTLSLMPYSIRLRWASHLKRLAERPTSTSALQAALLWAGTLAAKRSNGEGACGGCAGRCKAKIGGHTPEQAAALR